MAGPKIVKEIKETQLTLNILGRRLAAKHLKYMGDVSETMLSQWSTPPVLVFLHEGLGSMELWGDFPSGLIARCGLDGFLFDRYGHGLSEPLESGAADPEYLAREAWEFLPRILSKSCIKNPIFIGHSDGGTFALMYAAHHSDGVLGIITEAAHVFVDDVTRAGITSTVEAYRRGGLKKKLQKYHGPGLDSLFYRWSNTWLSRAFEDWNIVSLLSGVSCPVLAIQGKDDEYGTEAQVESICRGVSGRAESFMVNGARHIPHHQAREAVLERIVKMVSKVSD